MTASTRRGIFLVLFCWFWINNFRERYQTRPVNNSHFIRTQFGISTNEKNAFQEKIAQRKRQMQELQVAKGWIKILFYDFIRLGRATRPSWRRSAPQHDCWSPARSSRKRTWVNSNLFFSLKFFLEISRKWWDHFRKAGRTWTSFEAWSLSKKATKIHRCSFFSSASNSLWVWFKDEKMQFTAWRTSSSRTRTNNELNTLNCDFVQCCLLVAS